MRSLPIRVSVPAARSRTVARACVGIVLAAHAAHAQAAPSPLQRLSLLDAKKIASVERGDAVAVSVDAPDKTEIAILGVVRIDVPRPFYLDRLRQVTGFLASGAPSLSGTFGNPAKLDDVAALVLDPSDSKMLEKCRPLSCDLKLPATEMVKFRAALNKSPAPDLVADSVMRQWLVAYVNAYRADTAEETVVYDDTKRPVRSSDAFRALLADPAIAGMSSEPFAVMLASPRSSRPSEVTSRISWQLERMPGLKPTLEVVERSTYSSLTHPDQSWLTAKLLYASHYFESQIDFVTVMDAPAAAGGSAMYLVILRRSKFDDLPSGGLFNIRGKAVKKLRDALRSTLQQTRVDVEKDYAGQSVVAPRTP